MQQITILSPLTGWVGSLADVPDPVFAERMLGDGVAIQPLDGRLVAPCAGTVRTVHAAGHAVTIESVDGAELLIHLGLETVGLDGRGFRPLVSVGQQVAAGDLLIEFDLDAVAMAAASMVTPVLVTAECGLAITHRASGRVAAGEPLLTLVGTRQGHDVADDDVEEVVRRRITVPLAHGIHARPAARIGAAAKPFAAEVILEKDGRRSSARSPVGLLGLAIRKGDEILVEARGSDAASALSAVVSLILSGMEEEEATEPSSAARPLPAVALLPSQLAGIMAAPGLATGRIYRLARQDAPVIDQARSPDEERDAFAAALDRTRACIEARMQHVPSSTRGVMNAHLAILEDPELRAAVERAVAGGTSAGRGWADAIDAQAVTLRATGDARLAERIDDLRDVERQLLRALAGLPDPLAQVPAGSIVAAAELLPSELLAIDRACLAGICLERGGPTSHVAILCASMSVPALVAMGTALADVADGTPVALDADGGRLHVDPDADTAATVAKRMEARDHRRAAASARSAEECRTADGTRIKLYANLGSVDDARRAVENGAEGSGLLRSEFLFLDRDTAPDEDEQHAAYQAIADAVAGRPVIVRLLDIGGDKPAPYLPIAVEENPALGLRGIRVALAAPAVLQTQLRAILRVAPVGQCRIMVPMISDIAELRAVRIALDEARQALGIDARVELGIMVETPAAALTADILAPECDFLSIGSNDLAQYVLAMDRGNTAVAAGVDGLHPAVLRAIRAACTAAAAHGRWTGLCGGLASDPAAIPILVGLGISELSTVTGFVPEAKAIVRSVTIDDCRALASRALAAATAGEVRALAHRFAEELAS